ncbi:MAG: hypothetical protein QNJ33_14720 [Crocosphaera sp.]|nr:hypothetical protein [Crocosphaera sp.]
MTSNQQAKIYEFSRKFLEAKWSDTFNQYVTTGFDKEIGWESKKVPKDIINVVHNHLLRINDNYPPQQNDIALIARELKKYAILAVATRLMDDRYRPLVGYRYFWLEKPQKNDEIDGVGTLLKWWINQWNNHNYLCYELKPSAEHKIEKKHYSTSFFLKNELIDQFFDEQLFKEIKIRNNQSQNNLVIPIPYSLEQEKFHILALKLSQKYKLPLNWAYNVNKLEHPEQFTLIYSQNRLMVNYINQSYQSFSDDRFLDENFTDNNLKRCLMDIAKNKNLETNFFKLSHYLQQIDNHNWHWKTIIDQIFLNSCEDITNARYRGLLAILMPSPQVFEWLYWLKEKNNKQFFLAGIKIQDKLIDFLEKEEILDKTKIEKSIYSIIIELLSEDFLNQKTHSLLKEKEYLLMQSSSFWKTYLQDYGQILFGQLFCDYLNKPLNSDKLSRKISSDWKEWQKKQTLSSEKKCYYEWMARLFAKINIYNLAELFYQLSWGEIPADIYKKADIKLVYCQKSSRTSGLLKLSISNFIEELKFVLANLYYSEYPYYYRVVFFLPLLPLLPKIIVYFLNRI